MQDGHPGGQEGEDDERGGPLQARRVGPKPEQPKRDADGGQGRRGGDRHQARGLGDHQRC